MMLSMRGMVRACNKHVVKVNKGERQFSEEAVHQMIKHWKVGPTFCKPKGMQLNSNRLKVLMKAVFGMPSGNI